MMKSDDDKEDIKYVVDEGHLYLSAGRWTGPTGRTLTASWSGCSGT